MTTYLELWVFIVAMVATPGPANMLLVTAGAQQGYAKTVPFLAGLLAGKFVLNSALALGLMSLIASNPRVVDVFIFGSASYMAYLALRNWTPTPANTSENRFSFWAGSIVHPLSPKTWMMATLAVTQFGGSFASEIEQFIVVPISFLIAQLVFHSLWCVVGVSLGRVFEQHLILHRALILMTLGVIVWATLH